MELFLLLGFKIYKAIVLPKIKKMGFCYYLITMLILLIIKFNLIRKQGFSYEEVVQARQKITILIKIRVKLLFKIKIKHFRIFKRKMHFKMSMILEYLKIIHVMLCDFILYSNNGFYIFVNMLSLVLFFYFIIIISYKTLESLSLILTDMKIIKRLSLMSTI